jgi:Flp pilus assembly pilin Flp
VYIIETLRQLLMQVRNDERGVTTVEYAIMLVLIAIAVAAFGLGLSGAVTSVFSRMISNLAVAS